MDLGDELGSRGWVTQGSLLVSFKASIGELAFKGSGMVRRLRDLGLRTWGLRFEGFSRLGL